MPGMSIRPLFVSACCFRTCVAFFIALSGRPIAIQRRSSMRKSALSGCGLTLAILLISPSARAQTTSVGPYYATPSWDQKLPCDTPATCPRFVVLSNWDSEAVLDRETGLVWQRSPDLVGNQYSAQDGCRVFAIAGRYGWRLPKLHELMGLVDPDSRVLGFTHLPPGHPFLGLALASGGKRLWSAEQTQSQPNPGAGMAVDLQPEALVFPIRGVLVQSEPPTDSNI